MGSVTILPLTFSFEAIKAIIYPVVLAEDKELILVDCGYPNFLSDIENAMKREGLDLKDVSKIVITHHDHDHMGALREITYKYPEIEVLCSQAQEPYITGKKKSMRLVQAEQRDLSLTEEEKKESKKFIDTLKSVKTIDSVSVVNDGDVLPVCGGVEIIDTSGHMPGHISLYVEGEKTLIAGDALTAENGELQIANPQFTFDMDKAIDSIKKLLDYDIEKVICYHGGIYSGDIKSALQRIITGT